MARLSHLLLSALTVLTPLVQAGGSVGNSAVLDLLPSNFDEVVTNSGKPALVEFFAPWCGHCKTLAPIYEELGLAFAHVKDKVTIAKVDADAEKSLGKRFGVQGFPTLKWFDGKGGAPKDYSGGRDLKSLADWIYKETGLKQKAKKEVESKVKMLTDSSFPKAVGADQDVLVAFTAPWCGHCKTLAPTWETLATDFANEPSVLVAKVDAEADDAKALAKAQGVSSYPTIKFFPKGSSEAIPYEGGRSEADLVAYLNEKAGTHRTVGGALDSKAGTVAILDELVSKFVEGGSSTLAVLAAEAARVSKTLQDTSAAYYVKVFEKLGKNEGYAEKELGRLRGILAKGGLTSEKVDDLTKRANVLAQFVAEKVKEKKDEL